MTGHRIKGKVILAVMKNKIYYTIVLIFTICASTGHAGSITIKLASQAPEGHAWGNALQKMASEIEKATKENVKFRLSLGGVAGDEEKVMRNIRAGLLHGGAFTSVPLGKLNGNIRALEIPFTFNDNRAKAYETLNKNKEFFNKGLLDAGFVNIGFLELGLVYLVSSKPITNYGSLNGMKIWIWSGDPLSSSIVKSLGLSGVPMGMEQVRQSLSTQMVEAAYAPPMAIYALQWNSSIKTLVEFPLAYSVGAVIINKKTWNAIDPNDQKIVLEIANKNLEVANKDTVAGNQKALEMLKSSGVNFVRFSPEDISKITQSRQSVIKELTGSLFDQKSVDIVNANIVR